MQWHAPPICKKYEGCWLVQMPSTEQIYPLWEQLATILASEWPIVRKEYSDVNHGGLVHVVSDFNHQLERVVRVVQDALCDAQ